MLAALVCFAAGCSDPSAWDGGDGLPGLDPPVATGGIVCEQDDDCLVGESCVEGACRPAACGGDTAVTVPPLGGGMTLVHDNELVFGGNNIRWASSGSATQPWANVSVTDITRASWDDRAGIAVADGSTTVRVIDAGGTSVSVVVELNAERIASADIVGDGGADIVVADPHDVAVCGTDTNCKTLFEGGATVYIADLAGGDLNADGRDNLVWVGRRDGDYQAWWLDTDNAIHTQALDNEPVAVAIGDIEPDGSAEIAVLSRGGWLSSDILELWRLSGTAWILVASIDLPDTAVDLDMGDMNADGTAEIAVLFEGGGAAVYDGSLSAVDSSAASNSEMLRLALADADNDSKRATLVESVLVPGLPVPTVVMALPPYWRQWSGGEGSIMRIGRYLSEAEWVGDGVSLKANVSVGVKGGFLGLFQAEASVTVGRKLSHYSGTDSGVRTGIRVRFEASPESFGEHYGAVLLSLACYRAYTYEVEDDPNQQFVITVPVAGSTALWSSQRYNQLAETIDGLPTVEFAAQVGNPLSYPVSPASIDGTELSANDLVFKETPTFQVSDTADAGFSLGVKESEILSGKSSVELSTNASISMSGMTFGASVGEKWSHSVGIYLADSVSFRGSVPPLVDDPSTPEDEFEVHGYAFSPVVYRHHYIGSDGEPAWMYGVSFTASED